MKKFILAIFLAIIMLYTSPFEGYAGDTSTFFSVHYKGGHGHGKGHYKAGYGHGYGWGHHGRWRHHYRGYGYRGHHYRGPKYFWSGTIVIPSYPYAYPAPPPVVFEKQPPVYVQPQEENYWYYCPDPQGYYPYIRECAGGWMKVVPDVTPPNQ